jgi:hypothetical protein
MKLFDKLYVYVFIPIIITMFIIAYVTTIITFF